jgi:hypothetical protein
MRRNIATNETSEQWFRLLQVGDDDVLNLGGGLYKGEKLKISIDCCLGQKIRELNAAMQSQSVLIHTQGEWFGGIPCELLGTSGKGWEKGKIKMKVTVEFVPDIDEVPEIDRSDSTSNSNASLDDIRQMNV